MIAATQHEGFPTMKRLCLSSFLSVLLAPAALATTNYINYDTVTILAPPGVAPQIDASNFVNYGIFYVTNNYGGGFQPPLPYQTWNTRNWTNANRIAGNSGFRFNYFDSVGQTNGPSATFQNAVNVNNTNANIFGTYYLRVEATNINNKGTMAIGGLGLMTLDGKHIDLTRGVFGALGNDTNDLAGVRDLYWGVGEDIGGITGSTTVQNSMLVTTIAFPPVGPPTYAQVFQSLLFTNACGTNAVCTNGFTAYIQTNQVFFHGAIHDAINVLFLRQTNPAITTDVRFDSFGSPGADKMIQWRAFLTNRVTGAVTTNRLFLTDTFGSWFFPPFLVLTPSQVPYAADRFRPVNYSITHAPPFGYDQLPTLPPRLIDPLTFSGTNFPALSTNTAWAATLSAAAFPPDPTISGSTWTNVSGRIEIKADGPGSYLNMTRTLMDGQSYLLLSATNHFVGSTNAAIVSPVTDVYLSSTNGMMAISNLTLPHCPRMEGQIQVMSARWTNATAAGLGRLYTVTMVDSALNERPPARIQNLSLHSTNVLIGDALNVFDNLLIDAERITISTNAGNAPTPYGELNLTSGDTLWSPNLPRLQYLTNYGRISCSNSIFFSSNTIPPWFSGAADGPYEALVTHGHISSVGCSIWAKYFEASGTNDTSTSPLTVQADSAIVTNGLFLATDAAISITSGSLYISNQVLQAGREITLAVSDFLDDGSLNISVDMVTNKNVWTVGGGINLSMFPTNGASLLATTITNNAFGNADPNNTWAGVDYGPDPRGFVNNAALGQLILNGQDSGSIFTFVQPNPDPTNATALYVDLLELKGATAAADSSVNLVGVSLQTNFTIYYGDAVWNGTSIAEQINGRYSYLGTNGGRFVWVSNYNTGFFSSTNVTYTDGSGMHRLNRALVTSCTIDSNGNGTPNCLDPNPVPVFTPAMVALKATFIDKPLRSVVLSWNTVPRASNFLYGTWSLPPTTDWQLITQFLSSATSTQVTMTNVIQGSGPLYYRVGVLSP